jgi:hypothetical protein
LKEQAGAEFDGAPEVLELFVVVQERAARDAEEQALGQPRGIALD